MKVVFGISAPTPTPTPSEKLATALERFLRTGGAPLYLRVAAEQWLSQPPPR